MTKLFSTLMVMAVSAMTFTACQDVPEPYDIPGTGSNTVKDGSDTSFPYSSDNFYSGWNLVDVSTDQPWSQGTKYVQATGFQKWDGAENKSNRAVEGYLVSPQFSTVGIENAKISFDYTIKYTNNVNGWEANHKVYVSKNYDGKNIADATWTELAFKPKSSPYSDWTLYPSGEIQLPTQMMGQEAVYVAFWFKAPETGSTTWELMNFKIEEGVASSESETPGEDNPNVPAGVGTEDEPLTVDQAIAKGTGANAWVKGYIVGALNTQPVYDAVFTAEEVKINTNILIAASADETDSTKCMPVQLPLGAIRTGLNLQDNAGNIKKEVLLYGNIESYFKLPGLKSITYAKLGSSEFGTKPGSTETPSEDANAISFNFLNGQGGWTIDDKNNATGDAIWKYSKTYGMVATAYINKTNLAAESWLISPVLDLSKLSKATLKMNHAINFFSDLETAKAEAAVMISENGTDWAPITLNGWADKMSWTFFDSTADISAYAGKSNIKIALKYTSTAAKAGTWEIKSLSIE